MFAQKHAWKSYEKVTFKTALPSSHQAKTNKTPLVKRAPSTKRNMSVGAKIRSVV